MENPQPRFLLFVQPAPLGYSPTAFPAQSAGNMHSIRNACDVIHCGTPTVVISEKYENRSSPTFSSLVGAGQCERKGNRVAARIRRGQAAPVSSVADREHHAWLGRRSDQRGLGVLGGQISSRPHDARTQSGVAQHSSRSMRCRAGSTPIAVAKSESRRGSEPCLRNRFRGST